MQTLSSISNRKEKELGKSSTKPSREGERKKKFELAGWLTDEEECEGGRYATVLFSNHRENEESRSHTYKE